MMDVIYFDKTLKRGKVEELAKIKGKPLWIDITHITNKEAELMKTTFNLHPVTVEDIFNVNTRIKIEEFNEYMFCVFYGVQKNKTIELIEIDFVIGKNFVITSHGKDVPSFEDLKKDKERLESLFIKGTDFVFHKLLDKEIDNFIPVLEYIGEQIDSIEEKVTKKPRPEMLSRVLKIKRNILLIKKIAFPQRENISYLTKTEYKFISKKAIPYFRDIYDHSIRIFDSVDSCREAIMNTFDIYMSAVSNNMNEVMKVLSVIATIALPLTVISSIWGTNFRSLPGLSAHYGFWVMILAMGLLCLCIMIFFRKRGWF